MLPRTPSLERVTMQLSRESSTTNIIRAVEPGRIRIGNTWHAGHVIISREQVLADWAPRPPQHWALDDLELALTLRPEILLLGAGSHDIMPDVELMAALARANVGLEFMTTAAACRTYNVLAHEERAVVAALYNPPEPSRR
jgi:uncharacterized protein